MTDTTREIISKLLIKHFMQTNQALISDLVVLVDQAIIKEHSMNMNDPIIFKKRLKEVIDNNKEKPE